MQERHGSAANEAADQAETLGDLRETKAFGKISAGPDSGRGIHQSWGGEC